MQGQINSFQHQPLFLLPIQFVTIFGFFTALTRPCQYNIESSIKTKAICTFFSPHWQTTLCVQCIKVITRGSRNTVQSRCIPLTIECLQHLLVSAASLLCRIVHVCLCGQLSHLQMIETQMCLQFLSHANENIKMTDNKGSSHLFTPPPPQILYVLARTIFFQSIYEVMFTIRVDTK